MDNSPTALFDSYEHDFKDIIETVREKVEGDGKSERGGSCRLFGCMTLTDSGFSEQRKTALRRVEMELDEADELVGIMLGAKKAFDPSHSVNDRSRKWR